MNVRRQPSLVLQFTARMLAATLALLSLSAIAVSSVDVTAPPLPDPGAIAEGCTPDDPR